MANITIDSTVLTNILSMMVAQLHTLSETIKYSIPGECSTVRYNASDIISMTDNVHIMRAAHNSFVSAQTINEMTKDGISLSENIVKDIEKIRNLIKVDLTNFQPTDNMIFYMKEGRRVAAIKEMRELTNCGLREGKDWVDAYMNKHGWSY